MSTHAHKNLEGATLASHLEQNWAPKTQYEQGGVQIRIVCLGLVGMQSHVNGIGRYLSRGGTPMPFGCWTTFQVLVFKAK